MKKLLGAALALLLLSGTVNAGTDVGNTSDHAISGSTAPVSTGSLTAIAKGSYNVLNSILTAAQAIQATSGAVGDTAWSGSGNGTQVALQKAIWTILSTINTTLATPVPLCTGSPNCTGAIGGFNLKDTTGADMGDTTLHALKVSPPANQSVVDAQLATDLGPPGATACATDTGSCSINALAQRIAQRISSLITALGTPMQQSGGSVQPVAGTSGGTTPYHLSGATASGTNSTSIKGSAGQLYALIPINTSTSIGYLKIYDSASAPTCSSATGLKHVYPVPPAAASGGANGFALPIPVGEAYASGIGFCFTGGGGDTDNTNGPAGVYIEGSYK